MALVTQVIEIRPHHLLCLLTYIGEGYSTDFSLNFTHIIQRIMAGVPIHLVQGPDDICRGKACMTDPRDNCFGEDIQGRDEKALSDIHEALGITFTYGTDILLTKDLVTRLREVFRTGKIRRACENCMWRGLCTDVALSYDKVKLFPLHKGGS